MKRQLILIIGLLSLWSCSQDELISHLDARLQASLIRISPDDQLDYFILPESDDYDAIPSWEENPITAEKVELGKLLFYETGLARNPKYDLGADTYSCATCHVPDAGFMPGRAQGIADGGDGFGYKGENRDRHQYYTPMELDVQGARALSLLNVAYVTNTTWNGKFGANHANEGTEDKWGTEDPVTEVNHLGMDGLESQNIEGLGLHRMEVDNHVLDNLGYRAYFDKAFGDWSEEDRYSPMATSFAISAYLRTLLTTEAPFQKWLKGDYTSMDDAEKMGAIVFFGKAGCVRCHQGAGLNATEFYAVGVKDLYETPGTYATDENDKRNLGRGGFTGKEEDMFAFKVPGIYNMSDSPFYFHGSSKNSLREVVEYFNDAIPENDRVPEANIAPHFRPLGLTETEIDNLVSFLETGLRDPNLNRFVPEAVLSGNCFPNNDPNSKLDIGCN